MATNYLATNRPKRPAAVEANDKLTELNKSKRLKLVEKKSIPVMLSNVDKTTNLRTSSINLIVTSKNNEAHVSDSASEKEENNFQDSLPGSVGRQLFSLLRSHTSFTFKHFYFQFQMEI
jgi:hypothetical protein